MARQPAGRISDTLLHGWPALGLPAITVHVAPGLGPGFLAEIDAIAVV
jgi:hypothetical protein